MTIKKKLILGFSVMVLLSAGLAVFSLIEVKEVDEKQSIVSNTWLEFRDQIRQIEIAMLQARRSEKDFIARLDKKYIGRVKNSVDNVHNIVAKIKTLKLENEDFLAADNIAAKIDIYHKYFKEVAQLTLEKGAGKLGTVGVLRKAVHEIERSLPKDQLQLWVDMLTLRRREKDFLLRDDQGYVAKMAKDVAKFENHISKSTLSEGDKGIMLERLAKYHSAFKAVAEIQLKIENSKKAFTQAVHTVEPLIDETIKMVNADTLREKQNLKQIIKTIIRIEVITAVIIVILGILLAVFITRSVISGIASIVAMAKDISEGEGDLTARLDDSAKDELGDLARYFNNFIAQIEGIIREIKINADVLATASEELTSVSSGLNEQAGDMKNKSGSVASATEQMSSNINNIASASEEMAININSVSTVAEQMSSNMNTVASTVEEFTMSINNIAENSKEALDIASEAAKMSASANATMDTLGIAAGEIGNVTDVIKRIAEQTNLLALNATIEAASAGDAGKGFAVVANEIKELANQSATAAEDIASRIGGIQGSVKSAVSVIDQVSTVIKKIGGSVQVIDGAVEQQNKAAQDISINVDQARQGAGNIAGSIGEVAKGSSEMSSNANDAAKGAKNVAENIGEVNYAVDQSQSGVSQVSSSAKELSKVALEIKEMVAEFKVAS